MAADEFRLLCLSATEDANSPVHVTLEVVQQHDCPEYETVSYTWGGEDGDSTPSRPIFVGPYWDILLQSKNCWDMLRYLQPRRGIRMVWVDAICINQNDMEERAQQVAKMGTIYRDSSRVFVYLGSDIVSADTSKRRYPSRHGLHQFDHTMNGKIGRKGAITTTLKKLLTRRYFSRVWVIQELVLSRNAIIPVGDMQFWASNLTPTYMALASRPDSIPLDWNSTAAPWVQFMGGTSFEDNDLFQIPHRTWQSKASDPRDKLFGVLGLLKSQTSDPLLLPTDTPSPRPNMNLVPNYEISVRHAFIGFFGHILINLGVADVLMSASGLAALPGYPSWVPDWQGQKPLQGEDDIDRTYTTGAQEEPSEARLHGQTRGHTFTCIFPLSLQLAEAYRSHDHDPWKPHYLERLPQDSWEKRRKGNPKLYDMTSWRRNASIDSSTGALSIKLHHLFQFNASPVRTEVADLYELFEGVCSLFIRTQKGGPRLDALVPPGRNHLFYLEKEVGDSEYRLLFLRELLDCDSSSDERSFKLLLCCAFADIFLVSPGYGWCDIDLQLSLHAILSLVQDEIGGKEALEGSLYDALKGWDYNDKGRGMRQMFPWRHIPLSGVLRVFQGHLNEMRGQKPTFAEAYIQCVNEMVPHCDAKATVDEDSNDRSANWFELTLKPQAWAEYNENYRRVPYRFSDELRWSWRYTPTSTSWFEKKWTPCVDEKWGPWKPDKAVSVRAKISDCVENMNSVFLYRALRRLGYGSTTGEDEVTMVLRGPQWDDHFGPVRPWPGVLTDSFAADGVPWQVRIV